MWVRNLLGHDYHKMYLDQRKQRIDEYRSKGVPDVKMQDELAKMELMFIKNATMDHPFYGSRFARAVERAADQR